MYVVHTLKYSIRLVAYIYVSAGNRSLEDFANRIHNYIAVYNDNQNYFYRMIRKN